MRPIPGLGLGRTRTAAAAAAAPPSTSASTSVEAGKPTSFWTRMRQLQEDDIAVAVLVYELTLQGMVVTCDGHRGFIHWQDAIGALKEGRLSGGRVRRGDETLVGQQLLAVVHSMHAESGTLEFKCRPHPGREVQVGQAVTGVVRFLQSNGAWLDYGHTTDGFLSINHVSREPVEDLGDHLAVGQELKVIVRSVNREQGHVTLTLLGNEAPLVPATSSAPAPRKRLLLFGPADAGTDEGGQEEGTSGRSRDAPARVREEEGKFRADSVFKDGQLVTGVVRAVEPYGAFVDYGDTGDGLLHFRHFSQERVKDMRQHLAAGDEIKAILRSRNLDTQRAELSTKWLERVMGGMLRRPRLLFETAQAAAEAEEAHDLEDKRRKDKAPGPVELAAGPSWMAEAKEKSASEACALLQPDSGFQVGQLVTGVVTNVLSYGAFVDYGDARNGLLHISLVSHETVSDLSKVLTVGEQLKAILVLRDLKTQRVELSTKWLEREEGAMLRQPRLLYDTAEEAAEAEELGALGSTSQRRKEKDARDAQGVLEVDSRFQEGQLVTGVVRTIYSFGAFVDYGDTIEGLLHTREFSQNTVTHLHEYLAVGDELKAILQNRVVGSRRAMLSTQWLEREEGAMLRKPRLLHDTAEEAAEARRLGAPSSTSRRRQDENSARLRATLQPDSAFQVGQLVTGVVKSVHSYGAFVDYGDAREGLLHVNRISREHVADPAPYLAVGETIQAILHSRDLDTQRVVLSTKWLEREPGAMLRTPRLLYKTAEAAAAAKLLGAEEANEQELKPDSVFQVGQLVTGVVTSMTAYGAFVDYGDSKDGLLHVRHFSRKPVKDMGDYLAAGDAVTAILLSRDVHAQRTALSTKWLEREPGAMLRKPRLLYDSAEAAAEAEALSAPETTREKQARTSLDAEEPVAKFKDGQLVTGVVRGLTAFGAFVDYGDSMQGLLHISQFSQGLCRALDGHLAVGDELTAVLLNRDPSTRQATLSTKWLERQSGAMLRTPRLLYDTAEEAEEAKQRIVQERSKMKATFLQEMARKAVGLHFTPTDEDEFWARTQQLRLEGVAVPVIVKQIAKEGVIVTYQGRQNFLRRSPQEAADWADEGGEPLVGQQLLVYIQVANQKRGCITFRRGCRPTVDVKVGQVLKGTVQGVKAYGVFVSVGDVPVGLLHVSRVSQAHVEDLKEHFAKGDEIKVLVLSMKAGLTTLSTRHLEREPGGMLRRPRLLWDTEEEAAAELARQQQGAVASEGQ